jgi:ubiquinone/menaquinone biosynthesis C-methylase UbiE
VLLRGDRLVPGQRAVAPGAAEGVQLVPGEQLNRDRWRRYWDKTAVSYDRQMHFYDRVLLGDNRPRVCAQATGHTLKVAVGTGRNLPFYPAAVGLTGIDFSPAMLGIAQTQARQLGRGVDLQEADAQALSFQAASFDTVVCTFALCAIPNERRAVGEMTRVLRPGGLLLADHIAGASWPVRGLQRILELATVPLQGAHAAPPAAPGPGQRAPDRAARALQARDG